MLRRIFRGILIFLGVIAVLIVGGGIYARSQVRASLPAVDGTIAVKGLTASLKVDRDALGVPTITAASREDVARAMGLQHGDRDALGGDLQRRQPAGEALGGGAAPRAVGARAGVGLGGAHGGRAARPRLSRGARRASRSRRRR